jgi:CRP/FNR family cyclic AMP-dependent transcriptional regulator
MFLVADYLVRLYEQVFPQDSPEMQKNPRPVTLQKTRERLGEELGMNIKTLDRTIRSMHKDGYFSLVKGKITYGIEEYLRMKEYLSTAKG